jgi:hypothetical protein
MFLLNLDIEAILDCLECGDDLDCLDECSDLDEQDLISVGNNTVFNNTVELNIFGLWLIETESTVDSNTLCFNSFFDIWDEDSNVGNGNFCNFAENWEDTGATSCTHLCTGISLEKRANVSTARRGQAINWTIAVNNTGIIDVNVTLEDTNGKDFEIANLKPGELWNASYTTTAGYCDIRNTIEGAAENGYGNTYDVSDSASVSTTHCGDGECNCGETCRSCKDDCNCEEEHNRPITFLAGPSPPTPPPKPQISVSPDEPELGNDLIVIVTYPDGTPVEGDVLATAPDGTTMILTLTNGRASIPAGQPGLWTFSYTYEGGTITDTITVTEKPVLPAKPPEEQPTGQAVAPPAPAAGIASWVWMVAAIVLILIAALALLKNRGPAVSKGRK